MCQLYLNKIIFFKGISLVIMLKIDLGAEKGKQSSKRDDSGLNQSTAMEVVRYTQTAGSIHSK